MRGRKKLIFLALLSGRNVIRASDRPGRERLARRGPGRERRLEVEAADEPAQRMAFIGVRPCDLRAIAIQDEVLGAERHPGSRYASRRAGVFIVAVNCTEPGETCFCTSMGAGPERDPVTTWHSPS